MKKTHKFLHLFWIISLTMNLGARDLFVSPSGNDSADGSEKAPLRTVQAALDRAKAGDVCKVREGTYREKAVFKSSGEEGKPLRLQSYPGEEVIFDGTETVKGVWEKHSRPCCQPGGRGDRHRLDRRDGLPERRTPVVDLEPPDHDAPSRLR